MTEAAPVILNQPLPQPVFKDWPVAITDSKGQQVQSVCVVLGGEGRYLRRERKRECKSGTYHENTCA